MTSFSIAMVVMSIVSVALVPVASDSHNFPNPSSSSSSSFSNTNSFANPAIGELRHLREFSRYPAATATRISPFDDEDDELNPMLIKSNDLASNDDNGFVNADADAKADGHDDNDNDDDENDFEEGFISLPLSFKLTPTLSGKKKSNNDFQKEQEKQLLNDTSTRVPFDDGIGIKQFHLKSKSKPNLNPNKVQSPTLSLPTTGKKDKENEMLKTKPSKTSFLDSENTSKSIYYSEYYIKNNSNTKPSFSTFTTNSIPNRKTETETETETNKTGSRSIRITENIEIENTTKTKNSSTATRFEFHAVGNDINDVPDDDHDGSDENDEADMSADGFPMTMSDSDVNSSSTSARNVTRGIDIDHFKNLWAGDLSVSGNNELPTYVRVTAFIFLLIIFAVGTIGNTMVIIVIHCSRDMRTSTNIFLVNLSVADLLLLLICTPTCLMEVYYDPEIWMLGAAMCKLVPLLEVTVAHASVLTILAISFERYYAICCPLKANYVCTKTRAISICIGTWIAAGVITSPMYFMINYYFDGSNKPHCDVGAGTFWTDAYTISSIVMFFLLPLLILLITYGLIARNLTTDKSRLKHNYTRQNHRARQQVVLMLGTVVFTFFLCLLPFRVLTIFVVLSDQDPFKNREIYYNIEYFCRIMLYTNSALNPILYNIMSSKFRNGFLSLCSRRRRRLSRFQRQGTFHTLTTTSSTSTTSNLPNNFIHRTSSTTEAMPISTMALTNGSIDRNRNRNRHHNRNRSHNGFGLGYNICPYSCSSCCCHQFHQEIQEIQGIQGKTLDHISGVGFGFSNKNKNLDLDRYSYSFTNINLNSGPKLFGGYCKKCCEFDCKNKLGAKWLHKHLTLSPEPGGTTTTAGISSGTTTTTTTTSSGLILSEAEDQGGHFECGIVNHDNQQNHNHNHNNLSLNHSHGGNGLNGIRCCGGKCHCHVYCTKTFSRGISSENNILDKCFSLNCQICQRRRKGHILAAVQEDRNRRAKAIGVDGTGGKLTIKMAVKTNYYSCSFSSFSNTNTMETIL